MKNNSAASMAVSLCLLLLVVVGSDAFQTSIFSRKNAGSLYWGTARQNIQQPFALSATENNNAGEKAMLESMLDQAETMISMSPKLKGREMEALVADMNSALLSSCGADPAPTAKRSKEEVAKLFDQALNAYMDSMADADKAKMEALATEINEIDNPPSVAPAVAPVPAFSLASFQERLDSAVEKLSSQPAVPIAAAVAATALPATVAPAAPVVTSPQPVAEAIRSPPAAARSMVDAAFARMQPKPKQELNALGFPAARPKASKDLQVDGGNTPPVADNTKELEAKTVVPISKDAPAVPLENIKPLIQDTVSVSDDAPTPKPVSTLPVTDNTKELKAKTVVPITKDAPAVPLENIKPLIQETLSVSDDAPTPTAPPVPPVTDSTKELEAKTVVPITKDVPAVPVEKIKPLIHETVSVSDDAPTPTASPTPPDVDKNKELEGKTVVSITKDVPAIPVEKIKSLTQSTVSVSKDAITPKPTSIPTVTADKTIELEAKTVVSITQDAPAVPVEKIKSLTQKTVSVSKDPPILPVNDGPGDLEATTVVHLSKDPVEPMPKAQAGDVKVAISKPKLVPESIRSTKPRMESEPSRQLAPERTNIGSSIADDIAKMEDDIAKMEAIGRMQAKSSTAEAEAAAKEKEKQILSEQMQPRIEFAKGDEPDVDLLRKLMDEATVWIVAHGNEVEALLRKEVEEMIEEMAHILYYASSDDNSATDTAEALKVSGSMAVAFFKERISGLQGTINDAAKEVPKAKPDIVTAKPPVSKSAPVKSSVKRPPYVPKPAPIPKAKPVPEPVSLKKSQLPMDQASPGIRESYSAVDAAFKTMSTGKPTGGTPKSRSLSSDSTHVKLN